MHQLIYYPRKSYVTKQKDLVQQQHQTQVINGLNQLVPIQFKLITQLKLAKFFPPTFSWLWYSKVCHKYEVQVSYGKLNNLIILGTK